jgi:hypothetical protein
MLACTIFCIYMGVSDEILGSNYKPADGENGSVYAILGIGLLVHLPQFIAVNLQLFTSASYRDRQEDKLARV